MLRATCVGGEMERSEPSIAFLGESRPSLDQQSVVGLDHSFAQVRDDVCDMLVWSGLVQRGSQDGLVFRIYRV